MSFIDRSQKYKHSVYKSSGSEENFHTDEEGISEESLAGSIAKLKSISIGENHKNLKIKKHSTKSLTCRFSVPQRYRKSNRRFTTKTECQKIVKRQNAKNIPIKVSGSGKPTETPKKGKRCRLGGKAKGKPPEEKGHDNIDKHDSDDESDNYYFGRISLGYFQKFRDKSGASTSYQWDEDCKSHFSLRKSYGKWDKISDDKELLELQRWGMTAAVSSFNKRSDKLNRVEDLRPDT